MSIESMAIALHHSKASGTAKLIMIGIANHDGDGGAWPSLATLAKYANVDRKNAKRAIDKLISIGEIRQHTQGGGTASTADYLRPNLYEVLLNCPPTCDRSKNHKTRRDEPKPMFDASADRGALAPRDGDAGIPRGGTQAPPKPSLKPHLEIEAISTTERASSICGHEFIDGRCELGCTVWWRSVRRA